MGSVPLNRHLKNQWNKWTISFSCYYSKSRGKTIGKLFNDTLSIYISTEVLGSNYFPQTINLPYYAIRKMFLALKSMPKSLGIYDANMAF